VSPWDTTVALKDNMVKTLIAAENASCSLDEGGQASEDGCQYCMVKVIPGDSFPKDEPVVDHLDLAAF
jgi:hypothetical protein